MANYARPRRLKDVLPDAPAIPSLQLLRSLNQKKRHSKGMPLSIPKHLKKLFFHKEANNNCIK